MIRFNPRLDPEYARIGLYAAAILGALIGLCVFTGCVDQSAIAHAGSAASSGLQENLDTIATEAAATASADKANPSVQAHVGSLLAALSAARAKLPALNAALKVGQSAIDQVAALKSDFWSYKQHLYFWRIVIAGIALVLLVIASDFLKGFSAPVSTIGSVGFSVFTVGMSYVAAAVGRVNDRLAAWIKSRFTQTPPAAS